MDPGHLKREKTCHEYAENSRKTKKKQKHKRNKKRTECQLFYQTQAPWKPDAPT